MTHFALGNVIALDWLIQILMMNGRLIVLLACSLLLIQLVKGSAARRHLIITVSFFAAALLPLSTQLFPPFEIPFEVIRPIGISNNNVNTASTLPAVFVSNDQTRQLPLYLFLIYCTVTMLLVARIANGNRRVAQLVKHAKRCGIEDWQLTLQQCIAQLRLQQNVDIRHSDAITSPMTWGFRRSIILIPSSAIGWPESLRRSALLHELAHIKRKDCLTKQVARLVCALYWLNPLSWLALRSFNHAAESASDDIVLASGVKHSHYAQNLLHVAKQANCCKSTWHAAMSMAAINPHSQRSEFGKRVMAILNREGCHSPINWTCLCFSFLFVFGLLLPVSSLRAVVIQEIKYVVENPAKLIPMPVPAKITVSPKQEHVEPLLENEFDTLSFQQELKEQIQVERPPVQTAKVEYVEIPASAVLEHAKSIVKQTLANVRGKSKPILDAEANLKNETLLVATNSDSEENQTNVPTNEFVNVEQSTWDLAGIAQNHHDSEYLFTSLFSDAQLSVKDNDSIQPYAVKKAVTPNYPRRAQQRGIEGELTVEFSIDTVGQVINAKIINAQPSGVFERAVLNAVHQNRYSPQKIDGKPVPVSGIQEKYVFVLES